MIQIGVRNSDCLLSPLMRQVTSYIQLGISNIVLLSDFSVQEGVWCILPEHIHKVNTTVMLLVWANQRRFHH